MKNKKALLNLEVEIKKILLLIGNTSLKKLDYSRYNLYLKEESGNPFSRSTKDRSAIYAIKASLENGELKRDSILVESSSGNFGLALAMICHKLGLELEAVVDRNITIQKKGLIEFFAKNVTMVEKPDYSGGYLLTRINAVKERLEANDKYINLNQYKNQSCIKAFYQMGKEIESQLPQVNYIFVSVSTGATMTGLLTFFADKNVKIVGVDVEGSVIFEENPNKRKFSGLGSSQKSFFLLEKKYAYDYVIVSEENIISGCKSFFDNHSILVGASTGAIYHAIENYDLPNYSNVVIINHDDGYSYFDSVYVKNNLININ